MRLRRLELNGGRVKEGPKWCLTLPPVTNGYADAQIDDYGQVRGGRRNYPWLPGTKMRLRARFSHPKHQLQGTAGFGFWNAPFGDPTIRWPALPQAVWFFFGSSPTDLPLAHSGPGRGWFVSTLDSSRGSALAIIPLAPAVLLLNQVTRCRRKIWPRVQDRLGISFHPLDFPMDEWHNYQISWMVGGSSFEVDGEKVFETGCSPQGPLGFVCWIDNQFLVATEAGCFRWGTLSTTETQELEVDNLFIEQS
ncbi:MAG: hypothetical protein R3293_10085 [Candidatus Promineifilaceae bacterium]|nr:hypothetical protein [Candidatus Promineifilaceae bacterium]